MITNKKLRMEEKPKLRDLAERLCSVMLEVSGVDAMQETRRRPVVMARVMVANALLAEGYTEHAVGAVLGWDHATIHHYRNRMEAVLTTPGYEDERDLWKRFKRSI